MSISNLGIDWRQKNQASASIAHDPESSFCAWAYAIAANPKQYNRVSIERAKGAFDEWGVQYPAAFAERIKEMKIK